MPGLRRRFLPEGVEITSAEVPLKFPILSHYSQPDTPTEYDVQLAALEQLWMDGHLEERSDGSWLLPYEKLPEINDLTINLLDLPRPEAVACEVTTVGQPLSPHFRIRVDVRHPTTGPLALGWRRGPVFRIREERAVRVSLETQALLERVEDRPGPDAKPEDRLLYVADCKRAALSAGAHLDEFLKREEYDFPEKIELDLTEEEDSLLLKLRIPGLPQELLDAALQGQREIPKVATAAQGVRRQRVVLTSPLRRQVRGFQGRTRLTGDDIPRFLTNPEAYLPEGFNLSEFSKRVKGIRVRVYNSRPYLHVSRSKGGWLEWEAGVELEEESVGTSSATSLPNEPSPKPLSLEGYQKLCQQAIRSGTEYVRVDNDYVRIDHKVGQQFGKVIGDVERRSEDGRLPAGAILEIYRNLDELEFKVDLPERPPEHEWLNRIPASKTPETFCGELKPFQKAGYSWLAWLEQHERGGLLADEMGLGKTVQVIAHLAALHKERRLVPSLIVVPRTLLENWRRELARFAPGAGNVLIHEGPSRSRDTAPLEEADIVLTSYDTLRRDQLMLGRIDWKVIVADEAQYAKNPTAGRTSALKAMKACQPVALTGTPVENGLIEFWCILDWVRPGLLGSWRDFRDTWERPLVQASSEPERTNIAGQLLKHLEPHYLRRMKESTLDLPPKIEKRFNVPMSSLQEQLYGQLVNSARGGSRGTALGAITRLLITSAHPRALTGDWGEASHEELIAEAPKLQKTLEILSEVRSHGEKALVFADYHEVQYILQRIISRRFGVWVGVINGELTEHRQEAVDQFCRASGFQVLVLSPHVGGVGLNITAANHVIHYTRPWNPAKESQASDRAHRIGQTLPVTVYYPIVTSEKFVTVEARLDQLLRDKSELARDVLRPSNERLVRPEEFLDLI